MKRRVAAAVATVGLMVGVATVPAAAAPGGGCPRGFESFSPAPGDERADRNGDGQICVRFLRGGSGGNSVVPGVVIIDNNAR